MKTFPDTRILRLPRNLFAKGHQFDLLSLKFQDYFIDFRFVKHDCFEKVVIFGKGYKWEILVLKFSGQ